MNDQVVPRKIARNIEPSSLAEALAARGDRCPIPSTHDRLHEAHHWWHEMARNYHEPDPFRYALGAFIQASRNVTFMLQKEKAAFTDFTWYTAWALEAKSDRYLRWLNDARTDFVHRQALEPYSWLEMRCIGNPRLPHGTDDDPLRINVSPFACTHYYMRGEIKTDHGHEFIRYWGMVGLEDVELLEVCASVYDRLDGLTRGAHRQAGADMPSYDIPGSTRALPCMVDVMKHRIVHTSLQDGAQVWENEPPGLHESSQ